MRTELDLKAMKRQVKGREPFEAGDVIFTEGEDADKMYLVIEGHRQQTIAQGIVEKDGCEGASDHDPKARLHQRPHRMLPRRPAAKVGTGDEDGCPFIIRLVKGKFGIWDSLIHLAVAPRRKQASGQARFCDRAHFS